MGEAIHVAPRPSIRVPVHELRRRYRELMMGEGFSLPRRLFTTFGATAAAIALCLACLSSPQLYELWVIPVALLYGTFAEHCAHRWAMHREVGRLERIFLEHRVHHKHFTHEAMLAVDPGDFQMIMSSGALLTYFVAVFVLPPALLPWLLVSRNAALIYIAVGIGYFAAFELLHIIAHLDPAHALSRWFPGAGMIQRRHKLHHNPRLQLEVNFNVVLPLADIVLGASPPSST